MTEPAEHDDHDDRHDDRDDQHEPAAPDPDVVHETPTEAEQRHAASDGWRSEPVRRSEELHPVADPDLAALVQLSNAYGLEQDVVLTLSGQVLGGTMIGGRTYFDLVAESVQRGESEETMRGMLAAYYRRRGGDFERWGSGSKLGALDPEGPGSDDLPALPQVAYVHLRDVTAGGPGGRRLSLWRGRLADVVGWSVGTFAG